MNEEFNSSKIIAEMAKVRSGPVRCPRRQRTAAFADGGKIGDDGLTDAQRAKLSGARSSLGVSATAPVSAPQQVQQPIQQTTAQPQGIATGLGIAGLLKNRGAQIDKAAGYANGGKIKGIGTPTSDSIPAKVRETGEPIAVSTGERIVSAEQDQLLQRLAKAMGYESVDAFFEAGTGKPVGPTIKGGKKAAADGLPPELDPFSYRGAEEAGAAGPVNGPASVLQGIAAPITPSRTQPIASALTQSTANPSIASLAPKAAIQDSAPAPSIPSGIAGLAKPGRDSSGIITADSAKAAMAEPMQRSGGIAGSIDMAGVNGILERENKARGGLIESMIKANGGNGVGILLDRTNEDNEQAILNKLSPKEYAAHLVSKESVGTTARGQDLAHKTAMFGHGITARGQDLNAQTEANRLSGNPLDNQVKQQGLASAKQAGDLQSRFLAETDPAKRNELAQQIRVITGKFEGGPSLGQQSDNLEIDAARRTIDGLSPEDIKQRTANYTSTGRINEDYDENLSRAVKLANRRKVGDDNYFDQRQQQARSGGNYGDTMTRFRADRAMQGHKLGKQTDNGIEVFDSTGRLIGHYR
jgi:hypothetical protein